MKKTLYAIFALALAAWARAAENPDKYPSVGFTYTETHISDAQGGSFIASRPMILDVRVPASDSVTLGFHGGSTSFATSKAQSRSGFVLGASVRYYLPFRIVRD